MGDERVWGTFGSGAHVPPKLPAQIPGMRKSMSADMLFCVLGI